MIQINIGKYVMQEKKHAALKVKNQKLFATKMSMTLQPNITKEKN